MGLEVMGSGKPIRRCATTRKAQHARCSLNSHHKRSTVKRRILPLCQSEDLHLETIIELRRLYYKKHPIILDEVISGKLKGHAKIAARIGTSLKIWEKYLAEVPEIREEIKRAKQMVGRVSDYEVSDVLGVEVDGVDAL